MMIIQLDKQAHAWAGCAIFGLLVVVVPAWAALLGVVVAAVGKELFDRRTHSADWMDAAATTAGGLAALFWTLGLGMLNGS